MPFLYMGCYSWHIQHYCVPHEGIWGDVFGFFFRVGNEGECSLLLFMWGHHLSCTRERGGKFTLYDLQGPSLMDPFFVTHPLGFSTKKQKKKNRRKTFFLALSYFFQKRGCMNFLSSPNFPVFGDLAGNLERLPQWLLDS